MLEFLSQTVVDTVGRYRTVIVPNRNIPGIPSSEAEISVDTVFVEYRSSAVVIEPVDGLHTLIRCY
jgi:hypothetical protein